MKQDNQDIVIERSGEMKSSTFGVRDSADMVHIFGVLRSKLYSDKILAFIREYSTNAFDEHVFSGIREKPIQVTLPTRLDPYFKVRDFGRGLSEAGVREVYCMYGASTKRNSNAYNGQMGFGSKSAFAYSDFWQISSHHDGICSHYSVYIDETGLGEVTLMSENPTDTTGVEVSIPIDANDFYTVIETAKRFYSWFEVKPIFKNGTIDFSSRKEIISLPKAKATFYTSNSKSYLAVMGNVAYPIEISKFVDLESWRHQTRRTSGSFLSVEDQTFLSEVGYSLAVHFDIGELQISASRESLEYKDKTLSAIKAKLSSLRNEAVEQIAENAKSEVDIRLRVRNQISKMSELRLITRSSSAYIQKEIDIGGGQKVPCVVDMYNVKTPHEATKVNLVYSNRSDTDRARAHPFVPGQAKLLDAANTFIVLDDLEDSKEAIRRAKIRCEKEKNHNSMIWVFGKADNTALLAELTTLNVHKHFIVMASTLAATGEVEEDDVKVKAPKTAARKIAQEKRKAHLLVPSGENDSSARSINWKPYEFNPKIPTYYAVLENLQFKNVKISEFAPCELASATSFLIEIGALPAGSTVVGIRDKDIIDAETLKIPGVVQVVREQIDKSVLAEKEPLAFRQLSTEYQAYLRVLIAAGKKLSISALEDKDPLTKKRRSLFDSRINNLIKAKHPSYNEELLSLIDLTRTEIKDNILRYPLFKSLDTWKVKHNSINEDLVKYIKAIDLLDAQEKK